MNGIQALNLALAGLLTGNELATFAFAHPAASQLPLDAQRAFEQAITRRMIAPMAGLMLATVISGIIAATAGDGSRTLTVAGTACYAVMLATTIIGNMPLNAATLRADENTTSGEWHRIRRRWNQLHLIRNALNVAGLTLLSVAATKPGH